MKMRRKLLERMRIVMKVTFSQRKIKRNLAIKRKPRVRVKRVKLKRRKKMTKRRTKLFRVLARKLSEKSNLMVPTKARTRLDLTLMETSKRRLSSTAIT